MNCLLKYPTRSRPDLFQSQIAAWRATASGNHRIDWLVSADGDDPTMHNSRIEDWCIHNGITLCYGMNRSKVEACNANIDYAPPDWEVLVLVSDDMIPVPGWDATIAQHMPADLNCGLWFPDGRQKKLCTLSVFGRPILNNVLGGFVYHPEFQSVWADNYYQWLMQQHGLLKYVDVPIARHAWQEQNADALMQRNEAREYYRVDRATYERLTKENR